MTGAFKKLISAWRERSAIYRANMAETERVFDAEGGDSPTVAALEAEAMPLFREVHDIECQILSYPVTDPDDVRAKARWIAEAFDHWHDFTDPQMDALMAGWKATAET
ncbi:hypothetical protein [Oricola indica]|uniref:hypothetical protein n=1 Tax=Oricola indica TaxID=2872591 RepID=UPI003CCBFE31